MGRTGRRTPCAGGAGPCTGCGADLSAAGGAGSCIGRTGGRKPRGCGANLSVGCGADLNAGGSAAGSFCRPQSSKDKSSAEEARLGGHRGSAIPSVA